MKRMLMLIMLLLTGTFFLSAGEKSFAEVKKECRFLASKSKSAQLEELVRKSVDSGRFTPIQCRDLMNLYGKATLWNNQWKKGLDFLLAASFITVPVNINEYYITYEMIARMMFSRGGNPHAAIVILEDVLVNKELHPANGYTACTVTAAAYEKIGNPGKALEYYKRAVEYGKKVKYKFSYAAAEKAVKRLSE